MNSLCRCTLLVTIGCGFLIALEGNVVTAFSAPFGSNTLRQQRHDVTNLCAHSDANNEMLSKAQQLAISSMLCASLLLSSQVSLASEIGVEVEAPTFISGETVEVIQ